jgi:hypothetical protein
MVKLKDHSVNWHNSGLWKRVDEAFWDKVDLSEVPDPNKEEPKCLKNKQ